MTASYSLPHYLDSEPAVPTWCATPNLGRVIHRFFDTSPFSPSGRYLAATRLQSEDRLPQPGDVADVVVVDLHEGKEWVIAKTRAADSQLGAQVQWGKNDEQLFFNDMDIADWRPFGVLVNPFTGDLRKLEGTVYMVAEDGTRVVSPCLLRTGATQAGYGVVTPKAPKNHGASNEDGIFITDVASGRCQLILSLFDIVSSIGSPLNDEDYSRGDFYAAHVKWNPRADRLMLVLRWLPQNGGKMRRNLVTLRADGTDIRIAVSDEDWSKGGHHPNWCPDGERILMNLVKDGFGLSFVMVNADGSDLRTLVPGIPGSGHPTLHPDGRHILTDSYPHEKVAKGDGTSPIRLIDLETASETQLVRIRAVPEFRGPKNQMRVDLHPAWDRSYKRIAFNGFADGTRRVYISDLADVVAGNR